MRKSEAAYKGCGDYQAGAAGPAPRPRSLRGSVRAGFDSWGCNLKWAQPPRPGRTDYRDLSGATLALCPRTLGTVLDQGYRRTARPTHPASRVSLLERAGSAMGVMTNGRLWRLFDRATHAQALLQNRSGERLAAAHPSGRRGFRYFWFCSPQAFEPDRGGPNQAALLLDRLFEGSQQLRAQLGENLKRGSHEIFRFLPRLRTGIRRRRATRSYAGALTGFFRAF